MAKARHGLVQLEQIRSALRRLEAGPCGACITCEEPIAYARLLAKPKRSSAVLSAGRRLSGRPFTCTARQRVKDFYRALTMQSYSFPQTLPCRTSI